MINLLPSELQEAYRYGLKNTALRRWIIGLAVAVVGLGVVATYGLATLQRSTVTYRSKVAGAQAQLDHDHLKDTQAQVSAITSDFKLVVKVLSKEVLFSKLLTQIATVIPAKSSLSNLDISQSAGAIDITAVAADYTTATQVQVNLADSANKIFSKADIVSISCTPNPTNPKYPCTVQIRALFSSNNPFLFINNMGS